MKRIFAGLLTAIIMGLLIWTSLSRSPSSGPWPNSKTEDSSDQDSRFQNTAGIREAAACIKGLLAGAQAGDVAAYLDAFGGPLRARFEQEAGENGREAFALRLRRAGAARKSHAIFAPEPDGDRPDSVRITVESTFTDRLERQTFRLERTAGRWLVTAVETARDQVPQNPLGSPATFDAPEGVPVDDNDWTME